jgi:TM2 domain-containing membrane protein YozV
MVNEQPSSSSQENNVRSMQGQIIHVSDGTGIISGDDNYRYSFNFADILSNHNQISNGGRVDFQIEGEIAKQIIPIPGSTNILPTGGRPREKDKLVAGLLAIFLGGFGIHKFYLGYNTPGVIMLLLGTIGWLLILPALVNAIIAFIEGIIYITKSDQDFYDIYEAKQRGWF